MKKQLAEGADTTGINQRQAELRRSLNEAEEILLCGAPIAVGVVVYFFCVALFKSITREDCQLVPKGATIAKILHL